jgi:hypothetical protein
MSHDDRIRQLTGLFLEDLRAPIEASFERLLADLMAMAAEDRTAAIDEAVARSGADHQATLDAALAAATGEREQRLDALRTSLTGEREAALEALRAELTARHEEALGAERNELARQHQEALDALGTELALRHGGALDALREQTAVEHGAAVQELVDSRDAALAAVERERDTARSSVAELTDQLAAARAQHEQLTQLAHAEAEAAEELSAVAVAAHVAERQSELACSERVVAAIRALDEARTLTDILTALADHAASEAIRVAVLLVHGDRLRGWRLAGIGGVQAATIDLSMEQAGLIGRAVELGAAVSTSEARDLGAAALPPFLAAPPDRVGLALPILVGGRVVAVLYADDAVSDRPVVPSNWPEVAEVLARHAGRCLEVLTLSRSTALARAAAAPPEPPPARIAPAHEIDEAQEEESARRHARLLISEIKLYNEELVERGRREGNIAALLGPEIERARRLYEEKIPATVRQRADCFDEEIVRTLAGGDRTLLGQVT